jgi:tRNA nucleotidyltransferase (CCA-adding enzyme)
MEMFLVGGIVRDTLIGLRPKDHDFTVVLPEGTPDPFAYMRARLEARGVEVFVETPEFLTIRGRFARDDATYPSVAGDFVLARKDSAGSDGRRPDFVTPGTLADDLARRDFTVNAMAFAPDGSLIDLFNGRADLDARVLRFVGDPMTRIREDALRVMRALRFCVTKGFMLAPETEAAISDPSVPVLLSRVSEERRADELSRMFRFDTEASLDALTTIPTALRAAIFAGRVRLDSTLRA